MLKDLITSDIHQSEQGCGGCGAPIRDRFYLVAADRAWHGGCLRCCKCSQPLDAEFSCFAKEGSIYCKDDYLRLFSSRRCARCGTGLSSTELVMRARELVFHVNCFSCALCGIHLSAGDTAAIRAGRVLCGEHYDADISSQQNVVARASQFYAGSSSKGRPRKKKSSAHHSEETLDMVERGSSTTRMELMQRELEPSLDLTSYDGSQSPGSASSLSSQTRNKRMRTSFKHHQLRTMKSYFAINQNPDAKDLKQLAQKTGLSKRVLQVWFQNARAKWRRNVLRQESNPNQLCTGTTLHTEASASIQCSGSVIASSHNLEEIHQIAFSDLY